MSLIPFDGPVVENIDVIFEFSKDNNPVLHIKSGEEFVLKTCDCFNNQLDTTGNIESLDWSHINPATGPVYVEGAKPGDVLKVEILRIEVSDHAWMVAGEGEGAYGPHMHNGLKTKRLDIKDGELIWDDKLSFELDPMIGVIGVAPDGEPVNCGTPANHGGNMDNTMIREGATLYFPVFVEGALFAAGDFHALMGDGEVGVSGAEIAGEVHIRLSVIKNKSITTPLLINQDDFIVIVSEESLDKAADRTVYEMVELLKDELALPKEEIVMLLSLCADIEVCQIVDPQKTARLVISRDVLEAYDFTFDPSV